MPGSEEVAINWRGTEIDGASLMVFPDGAELDALSDASFHVFTCSFSEELLDDIARNLGINAFGGARDQREVIRCNKRDMTRLRNLLRGLCRVVATDEDALRRWDVAESMAWELPALLLQTDSSAQRSAVRLSASRRRQLLDAAEKFIEHHADEPLTVAQVCRAVDVSLRTLQYAFAEKYGITPKAYIRAIRLNKVRKLLRSADPQQRNVADIANQFGFWHMGQFAADYRRHFAELPSRTLKSKWVWISPSGVNSQSSEPPTA